MCSVSMIMDHYHDKWNERLIYQPMIPQPMPIPTITPEEVAEFRKLLDRAREYDRKMNQPDCELEEKRQAVKEVARKLGVEIEFV